MPVVLLFLLGKTEAEEPRKQCIVHWKRRVDVPVLSLTGALLSLFCSFTDGSDKPEERRVWRSLSVCSGSVVDRKRRQTTINNKGKRVVCVWV